MIRKIGDWIADERADTLARGAERHKLERRAMAVLAHLADRPGEVVSKDDLIEKVWGAVAISDHSVAIVISQIRRALGDDPAAPRYIETIPKRGYRLLAQVAPVGAPAPPAETEPVRPRRRHIALIVAGLSALAAFAALPFAIDGARQTSSAIAVADFGVGPGGGDKGAAFALSEMVAARLASDKGMQVLRWRGDLSAKGLARLRANAGGASRIVLLSGYVFVDRGDPVISIQMREVISGKVLGGSGVYGLDDASLVVRSEQIAREAAAAVGRDVETAETGRAFPPEAHARYWRARHAWAAQGQPGARQARAMLLALLDDFPDFAPAHAALADMYVRTTPKMLGVPHPETAAARSGALVIAERYLNEARRLAGETGETAVIAANLELARAVSLDAALAKARRATEMAPASATAWQVMAESLCMTGRDDEALSAIGRAIALDPADSYLRWDRVFYLHVAGRQREALAAVREAELYGPAVYFYAALVHDAMGNDMEALRAWLAVGRRRGLGASVADAVLRTAAEGGAAAGYAALLRAQRPDGYFEVGGRLAVLRLKAGDRHGAVRAMLEAPSQRRGFDILFHRLPVLAPLRSEPRLAYLFKGIEHPPGRRAVVRAAAGRP